MNFIKRCALKIAVKILDESLEIDYKKIDQAKTEEWMWRSFDDRGWKSYLGYETLKIMKSMAQGQERDQYMVLVGRRIQLLYLADEMRKVFENRKSVEEKKAAEAKKEAAKA